MHPEPREIRDGFGAFLAAIGWPNRGRHRLSEGGRRSRCRQCHDQKEIPSLSIHALLPFYWVLPRSSRIKLRPLRVRLEGGLYLYLCHCRRSRITVRSPRLRARAACAAPQDRLGAPEGRAPPAADEGINLPAKSCGGI